MKTKLICLIAVTMFLLGSLSGISVAQERVTLNCLLAESLEWMVLTDHFDDFYAKYPHIRIDPTYLSHKEGTTKIRLELATGSPTYDLFANDNNGPMWQAPAGWIAPVPEEDIMKEAYDIPRGYIDALKVGDNYYGIPMYGETVMLMFRSDLFGMYGLSVPKSISELRETAKKLTIDTDKDGRVDVYGFIIRGEKFPGHIMYAWSPFFRGFGGWYFDKDWNPIFDSPEAIAATEVWAKIIQESCPPGVASWGWPGCLAAVYQGKVAMWLDGTPFGPRLNDPEKSQVAGKIGYALSPMGPEGIRLPLYVATHVINIKSEHKEEAWEFCKWAASPEMQKLYPSPARYSAINSSEFVGKNDFGPEGYKYPKAMMENMKYAELYFPPIPEWPAVGDAIALALNEVILGKPVHEALRGASQRVYQIMEKAGYYK